MFKTIVASLAKTNQDVTYQELLAHTRSGDRIRISIRSNSYQDQSEAKVELWDGKRWNLVWWLSGYEMQTAKSLYYRQEQPDPLWFSEDRKSLIDVTESILGI